MYGRDDVFHLLQLLYAAPGSIEGWRSFLLALCETVDGTSTSFISHNRDSHDANISLIAKCDPVVINKYATHWGQLDPWVHSPRAANLDTGFVGTGEELISSADLRRTPYYNDFATDYDITQALAGMVEAGAHGLSFLSINRGESQPRFGAHDVELLRVLMPHLQRALQIHQRLAASDSASQQLIDALERLGHGVVFVDARGRIASMNTEARRIFDARDGLAADREEIRPCTTDGLRRWRVFLADAIKTGRREGIGAGGTMPLPRPSGKRPYQVVVAPMPKSPAALTPGPAGAMVLITDPDRRSLPTTEMLRAEFGLTPAEAQLVRALVEGLSLQDAARRLNVTINTARSRLKVVFEKTATHRQAELLRRVLQ